MSLDAMKQALDALEEMKAEFRALDLPYGSKAYTKANNSTHALRAAIDQTHGDWDELEALRASLREHMAEIHRLQSALEQEPVAWMHNRIEGNVIITTSAHLRYPERWTALYTAPPPCPTCEALARSVMMDQTSHDMALRQWQGLTDEEIYLNTNNIDRGERGWAVKFARVIEAKLREKNT